MEYRASLDVPAKLITVITFLLLGFLIYRNAHLVNIPAIVVVIITMLFFMIFVGAFLYGPNKYIVKNGMLTIVRPINKVNIPLNDIREVRVVGKDELGTLIRTWGSGGLFGYYGYFRSTRLGKLKLYTTRRDRRILITTVDDERILLSPNDLSMVDVLKI